MYALMTARYGGKGQGQMFETDRAAQLDTALRNSERGDESRAVSYPVCVNGKCGQSSGEALAEFEFSVRGVVKRKEGARVEVAIGSGIPETGCDTKRVSRFLIQFR